MSPKVKSIVPMKPKPLTLSNKSLILTSLINDNWLIELYNVLTTADGRDTVLNGWKKSGVTAVLKKVEILPPKGPIQ